MSRLRESEPQSPDAPKASVTLADGTGDLPRAFEVGSGEVDVERDQWGPRSDENATRPFEVTSPPNA